jgi:hypothetical protein
MSLRQLRKGEVSFYSVKDFLTGEWLFKICRDKEEGKIMVKALKCPAGIRFSQLEGRTMVFQQSKIEGMLYDIISLSEVDKNNRLRRNVVSSLEEIPAVIKENFVIKPYEEATGKKAIGKSLVTLTEQEDEKELVTLFVLERAWALSESTPEEKLIHKEQSQQKTKSTKKEVDTGEVWSCPICRKKHQLIHVETEKTVKHVLRKQCSQ